MKNKAIFLDRDGTINVDIGYTHKIEDLKIIPEVIEGLKMLGETDYKLIIVTNQSGIGRGHYTEEDYHKFREEIQKRLRKEKINIDAEYFCSHNPNENCNCRKPKIGMLEKATKDFNIDLTKSWMIGDNLSDIQAGKNAGCKTIHILTQENNKIISEADFVADNFLVAADYILSQNK